MRLRIFIIPFLILAIGSSAFGDEIKMKNGDIYRADILKEEFGNYVQILLKDGSEKRLLWNDIDSINRTKKPTQDLSSIPATPPQIDDAVLTQTPDQTYPSEMLNNQKPFRLEVDLAAFSYDTTWEQISLQATGSSSSTNLNRTNHYFRTAPVEFFVAAYLNRWHAYFNMLNAATNSNDETDSTFSTFAFTYGLSRKADLGLFFSFSYANTSANDATSTTTVTGSAYGFGPFMRVVAPVSDNAAIEIATGAGLDFRSLNVGTSSASLDGNDTAFIAMVHVGASVSLSKHFSYVGWVDGWFAIGTLSGKVIAGNTTTTGDLQDNVYRLRVVPIGLRFKL